MRLLRYTLVLDLDETLAHYVEVEPGVLLLLDSKAYLSLSGIRTNFLEAMGEAGRTE